jgi:IS6 family transposase
MNWRRGHCADHQLEVRVIAATGWVPVPARGDRSRGALVLALRLVRRDVEELLAERGIVVAHITVYRWVQTFTSKFIDAARPTWHASGDRWFVDETCVKVAGRWTYPYRAVDQHDQVIDVMVSSRRNAAAARALFTRALRPCPVPAEVTTDRAPVQTPIIDELAPRARHVLDQHANKVIEADHRRLKSRLQPMRGFKRIKSALTVAAGHAFVQNLRRGHYELGIDQLPERADTPRLRRPRRRPHS